MSKGQIFFYKTDTDLLQCDCSACENVRMSYENTPKRPELTCRERIINCLRKIIFR